MPNEYLNEIEKNEVEKFANNLTLKEAVRKVLLLGLYYNGTLQKGQSADPQVNFALSIVENGKDMTNEEIGEKLKAKAYAISLLQSAFKELEAFKTVEKAKPVKANEAR